VNVWICEIELYICYVNNDKQTHNDMTKTFTPGQIYTNESSCIGPFSLFTFMVVKRTDNSLTIQEPGQKPRRVKVKVQDGVEFVSNGTRVIQFHTFCDNR